MKQYIDLMPHQKSKYNEGKAEGKAEIARKMLIKGVLLEDIIELTELSLEEIEKLKE
ncbi:hypothetical protein H6P87_00668 [Rickettsia tillamookensis]|uniref:Transposase n=1 Tax=Rickettsia tillamookensis TaxID=2761623 RepID=A0A9E6MHE3_9RICK|nr:hypothetical protein [Rickettsia tillamookensis]QQV75122.1 hypothetical protein H6P87_00668 [Rickettsia tillamookensis]